MANVNEFDGGLGLRQTDSHRDGQHVDGDLASDQPQYQARGRKSR